MPTEEFTLRPGGRQDLSAMAEQFVRVRAASVPQMPPGAYAVEDVRTHFESWDLNRREVWVAEADGRMIGQLVLDGEWLEGLYVEPDAQRVGVGSALLDIAKMRRPTGFALWVFVTNRSARSFYRAHGLIELEETDGSANPEAAPDLRMAWPGGNPLKFLRRSIDEVDEQLGDLLARRAALTRAVQPYKVSPGRDAAREREIAAGVARRAPALGEDRVQRIMDVIIAESLGSLSSSSPGDRDD